jgi:HNH endonuclease
MLTCIYCRETSPAERYKKREHVISQAFGDFKPDNMILYKEVCGACNQFFGDELEVKGNRASVEGIHRFTQKMMGVDSFLKMPKGRVRWEMQDPGWQDLKTDFRKTEDREVEIYYKPQVLVTYEDGTKKTFFPEDITDISQFDNAKGYRAFIVSLEDAKVIREALGRVGITPSWGEINDMPNNGETTVSTTAYIVYDDFTRRLMAKIVFNYLAYNTGAPFVLKPEFDAIRRFIRYGEGDGEALVRNSDEPFIQEEKGAGVGWYLTDDHLVGVRDSVAGGILGDVAIFNLIHYHVVLSRTDAGLSLLPKRAFGNAFSWRTGTIDTMLAWGEENLVQPFSVLANRYAKRRGWRRQK